MHISNSKFEVCVLYIRIIAFCVPDLILLAAYSVRPKHSLYTAYQRDGDTLTYLKFTITRVCLLFKCYCLLYRAMGIVQRPFLRTPGWKQKQYARLGQTFSAYKYECPPEDVYCQHFHRRWVLLTILVVALFAEY